MRLLSKTQVGALGELVQQLPKGPIGRAIQIAVLCAYSRPGPKVADLGLSTRTPAASDRLSGCLAVRGVGPRQATRSVQMDHPQQGEVFTNS